MEQRYHNSPNETKNMNTEQLRNNFLIDNLMQADKLTLVYSHYDRMIIGGAVPATTPLTLNNEAELRADFFLERRELGIINVGGNGKVEVDGKVYELGVKDCLYVGRGQKRVVFSSDNSQNPAVYYLLSAPAHKEYATQLMKKEDATPTTVGSLETSNHRTIYKYIHKQGIESCQLVMGLTTLNTGSVWNTMPSHTHDRRMEAYFYFDVQPGQAVVHFMGQPTETRHIMVHNHQALISPPWSIHSGCGTANYSFIWGMAGENQDYADMDAVKIDELR
ncbi:5-dehydro-4-deoxy-D-glucuronate isomerase [Solitalea longa]|uniref:4-deoxy-L-threo-5-hexosulose-uronate ketol-isomerase n=1 Tax=Solitalea longa TaxID=2079460 RepID=A0A2S5A0R1_9SPHI|nr:5-dehydro-4-deoxy-D-glucuronate isomerase [Solitalea longa]POY35842.1 5-dehydro-4-deoxy-D-glucuronate isomerase [Solitalea longa]